jgi:signal transduction histidine kinase
MIRKKKHIRSRLAIGLLKAKVYLPRFFARQRTVLIFLAVFGVEVGLGVVVTRNLFNSYVQVQEIYAVSIQGLRRIGELQYDTQEARRSTLYALTTNNGNLQVQYADQSRAADQRVSKGIGQYLEQARLPREIELGEQLANHWDAYLKVRDEVLGLILEGSTNEAVSLDLTEGVPLFERVRQDVEGIKVLFDERASQQLAVVTSSSRRSVLQLIASFMFALFLGSVAIWAIDQNQMHSKMQLAKLQMNFVASISHELRTPITVIICAGDNVRGGYTQNPEELQEQGAIIVDQAEQLAGLVDQVLLFAPTASKPRYALRPVQVPVVVARAIKSSAVVLQKSDFEIEQSIEQGLPQVVGDLSAISQCLQNLIVNAVKYSNGDPWIRISARIHDALAERKEVRISVEDHGPGIPSSELTRIFEPFYRSPQAVAAQIRGTGLGLSNAKTLMEAIGGRLSVVSEVGVGSAFTLHLPAEPQDSPTPVASSATDSVGS